MYRFNYMYLDIGANVPDAVKSAQAGELLGITDESKGGIIAYAIGEEHADLLVQALRKLDHDKRSAFSD